MEHLYVCHFSNGFIKVGRSIDPTSRIATHAARVACVGIELVEHQSFPCLGWSVPAERALIEKCRERATDNHSPEWFAGLDFSDVCEWALASSQTMSTPHLRAAGALEQAIATIGLMQSELASELSKLSGRTVTKARVWNWIKRDGGVPTEFCALIEKLSNGHVKRWHLRPDDWHLIWPELKRAKGAPAVPPAKEPSNV